jgi:hypothetical protein
MSKKNKKLENESSSEEVLRKIANKKNYIISIFASIIFSSIILYKVMPLFNEKSVDGAFIANEAYSNWVNSSFQDKEALSNLKYALKKYPNLKTLYEGNITQGLMIKNEINNNDMKHFSKCVLKTKNELPFYSKYSNISLLIAKKNYTKALKEAIDLKELMKKDLSFLKDETLPAGPILYSLNLLRIAILNKELNLKDEKLALEDLENYLGYNKNDSEINPNILNARIAINKTFSNKNLEIKDYIDFRKNLLKSKKFTLN